MADFPAAALPVTESAQATESRARPTVPLRAHGAHLHARERSVASVRVPATRLRRNSSPRLATLQHVSLAMPLQAACARVHARPSAGQLWPIGTGWASSVGHRGEAVIPTSEQVSRDVALRAKWACTPAAEEFARQALLMRFLVLSYRLSVL